MHIKKNNFIKKLFVKYFVKTQVVPSDIYKDFKLDKNDKILYILHNKSLIDYLVLKATCAKLKLTEPNLSKNVIYLNNKAKLFKKPKKNEDFQNSINKLLKLNLEQVKNYKIILTSIFWGRAPGKEGQVKFFCLANNISTSRFRKFLIVIFNFLDNHIRFSFPIELNNLIKRKQNDENFTYKLEKVAHWHFAQQKLVASGPKLPNREFLKRQILNSAKIQEYIKQNAKNKLRITEKNYKLVDKYFDEIASDFSYSLINRASKILNWMKHKIYSNIQVNNAEMVRNLVAKGHEIIFIPCHKSHMDYMLISFILYEQGMMPPHIAAGINLNFFPVGGIFRRGGAFFIRRSFKGNKLYSLVFQEYLHLLFTKGYSVEFFIEGGRSRTGKLLEPKLGMLNMISNASLTEKMRPISIVPVYLGYEHVMEVNSYYKELAGNAKKKESFLQLFGIFKKLRNFGEVCINFANPIDVKKQLQILPQEMPLKDKNIILADTIMTNINSAVHINSVNLVYLIIKSTRFNAINEKNLIEQISLYQNMLSNIPYSELTTCVKDNPLKILEHALKSNKFNLYQDELGRVISLDKSQAILGRFYVNSIIHAFTLASVIAYLIVTHKSIIINELIKNVKLLYRILKEELFLNLKSCEIDNIIHLYIDFFEKNKLILIEKDKIKFSEVNFKLNLLANIIENNMLRYAILIMLMLDKNKQNNEEIIDKGIKCARRFSILNSINSPDFTDIKVIKQCLIRLEKNFNAQERVALSKIFNLALKLDVKNTIENINLSIHNIKEENP